MASGEGRRSGSGRSTAPLPDQVRRAGAARVGRVHRTGRKHQAIAGPEPEGHALRAERDLAVDHPQALVVIVAVGGIVCPGRILPAEDVEAVARERLVEASFDRVVGPAPGDAFEPHGRTLSRTGGSKPRGART